MLVTSLLLANRREPLKGAHEPAWRVEDFATFRPNIVEFIEEEVRPAYMECRMVLVKAPVKSGKREMVEYAAVSGEGRETHVYITSLNRKADKCQHAELGKHGVTSFVVTQNKSQPALIELKIRDLVTSGKLVIIHIDEADYGSGSLQSMDRVYSAFKSENLVRFVCYSATPEELLWAFPSVSEANEDSSVVSSDDVDTTTGVVGDIDTAIECNYVPPNGYCGAATFLEHDLVRDAERFITVSEGGIVELTLQGKEVIQYVRDVMLSGIRPGANVAVVRLTTKEPKMKKDVELFLNGINSIPELADAVVYANVSCKITNNRVLCSDIDWSNQNWWDSIRTDKVVLIVIDQTCSRATEIGDHSRIACTHDYRKTIDYATVAQAQLRCAHYNTKYSGVFQQIRIWGDKKTFMLAAGMITHDEYTQKEFSIKKINDSLRSKYMVFDSQNRHVFPEHYSRKDATRIANQLNRPIRRLSCRVRTTSRTVPNIEHEFFECESANFADVRDDVTAFILAKGKNPGNIQDPFAKARANNDNFANDGIYYANGRTPGGTSTWKRCEYNEYASSTYVVSYHKQYKTSIVYNDGRLGVCVFVLVGDKTETSHNTYNSMYN